MELKNIALTAILTTLLITKLVESAGRKTPKSTCDLAKLMSRLFALLAPPTLNGTPTESIHQGEDRLAPSCEKPKERKERKKRNSLPKPSTGQGIFSVPVEDLIASSPEGKSFVVAVQDNDMSNARNIFDAGGDELKKYCVKHLVGLESSKLVELMQGSHDSNKKWVLQILSVHADQPLIDAVFKGIEPSNDLLRDVARSADLACLPQRFTYLLEKIGSKKGQEGAVERGAYALVYENKTECLDPLLIAFREGKFPNKDLENVAIRKVFLEASRYKDDRIIAAKRFFDHPAISAMDYSSALYNSYQNGGQDKKLFCWLLERADNQDLKTVKSGMRFSDMEPEVQQAVNDREKVVGTETRHEMGRRERIALMKGALENIIPKDLLNLISGY